MKFELALKRVRDKNQPISRPKYAKQKMYLSVEDGGLVRYKFGKKAEARLTSDDILADDWSVHK